MKLYLFIPSLLFVLSVVRPNVTIASDTLLPQHKFDVTIAVTSSSGDDLSALSISPLVKYTYQDNNDWYAGLVLGFGLTSLEQDGLESESSARLGNPLIFAGLNDYYSVGKLTLDIGLLTGIPLATFPGNIPDNRLAEFNNNNANSARGWRDPFVWMMNVVPIALQAEFDYDLSNNIDASLKLSPAFLLSINSRPSNFVLSSTLETQFKFDALKLNLGWASIMSMRSLENNFHGQSSLYLGLDIPIGQMLLKPAFNLNIDEPYGVAASSTKPFWGVQVGLSF